MAGGVMVNSSRDGRDQSIHVGNGSTERKTVVCFGEILVDFVPTVTGHSLSESETYERGPGGAPANVAVAVARLGAKSAMVAKVGDDAFGHMLLKMLQENGVDSRAMVVDGDNNRTTLAFVTLNKDGEREFTFFRNPGADMMLQVSELNKEVIVNSIIFHCGSISLTSEPSRSAQLAAMKMATSKGALLSYDVNLRLPLWPSEEAARQGILSIWEDVDVIKVTDDELRFLVKVKQEASQIDEHQEELRQVRLMWHSRLKLMLVTHGRKGCGYYTPEFHGKVEGVQVESVVDTTGAGDAFMGGFLFQLSRDMNILHDQKLLKNAMKFANACGALTTMERGAIPALPCQESVLRLLRGNSSKSFQ